MTRGYIVLIAAIVSFAGTPAAIHGQSPADIRVGYRPLTLVPEGSRTDQLGGETIYTVAVMGAVRKGDVLLVEYEPGRVPPSGEIR
jgi:hypothetical protein